MSSRGGEFIIRCTVERAGLAVTATDQANSPLSLIFPAIFVVFLSGLAQSCESDLDRSILGRLLGGHGATVSYAFLSRLEFSRGEAGLHGLAKDALPRPLLRGAKSQTEPGKKREKKDETPLFNSGDIAGAAR